MIHGYIIFCRRLAGSDVTVTPPLTLMNWLYWWHNHAVHLRPSSTELAFSEKCKSKSPSTLQVKNCQKTIGTEEKLDVMSRPDKGEQIFTYAVTLDLVIVTYIQFLIMLIDLKKVLSVWITFNASSLKQGVFVCAARLLQSYWNEPYQKTMNESLLHFYCIRNKEIHCTEMYVYCKQLCMWYIYKL
jgi:hypothetical protein